MERLFSKQNLLLLGIMISAVLIDQLSKIWLTSTLQIGESIELLPSFFKITYAQSTGAEHGVF